MFKLLENYKNPELILSTVLQSLHDQVSVNRPIAHYFMNVRKDMLISDVNKFSHFLIEHNESHYRDHMLAQKTSMPNIKVNSSVFEEVDGKHLPDFSFSRSVKA